jgi:hypothetical protein
LDDGHNGNSQNTQENVLDVIEDISLKNNYKFSFRCKLFSTNCFEIPFPECYLLFVCQNVLFEIFKIIFDNLLSNLSSIRSAIYLILKPAIPEI